MYFLTPSIVNSLSLSPMFPLNYNIGQLFMNAPYIKSARCTLIPRFFIYTFYLLQTRLICAHFVWSKHSMLTKRIPVTVIHYPSVILTRSSLSGAFFTTITRLSIQLRGITRLSFPWEKKMKENRSSCSISLLIQCDLLGQNMDQKRNISFSFFLHKSILSYHYHLRR